MLTICSEYSRKWRYDYNSEKSGIIVFNNRNKHPAERVWTLGSQHVNEVDEYTHLGITCDKNLSSKKFIQEACSKLRGTYLGIVNSGLHPEGLNPLTYRTIYASVVIPKAMYGCELLNSYSKTEMNLLERSHRFCIKSILGLKGNTNTNYSLATIDMDSCETIIDSRKLTFFGQLCRLPTRYMAKTVFLNRLTRYLNCDEQIMGFIPDIYRILVKYNLLHVLQTYTSTGIFPSKCQWKNVIQRCVAMPAKYERLNALLELRPSAPEFLPKVNNPCALFSREIYSKDVRLWIMSLVSVVGNLFSRQYIQSCSLSNATCINIVDHVLNFCIKRTDIRQLLWSYMFETMGINAYVEWIMCARERQTDQLIALAFYQATCRQYTFLKMLHKMFRNTFT